MSCEAVPNGDKPYCVEPGSMVPCHLHLTPQNIVTQRLIAHGRRLDKSQDEATVTIGLYTGVHFKIEVSVKPHRYFDHLAPIVTLTRGDEVLIGLYFEAHRTRPVVQCWGNRWKYGSVEFWRPFSWKTHTVVQLVANASHVKIYTHDVNPRCASSGVTEKCRVEGIILIGVMECGYERAHTTTADAVLRVGGPYTAGEQDWAGPNRGNSGSASRVASVDFTGAWSTWIKGDAPERDIFCSSFGCHDPSGVCQHNPMFHSYHCVSEEKPPQCIEYYQSIGTGKKRACEDNCKSTPGCTSFYFRSDWNPTVPGSFPEVEAPRCTLYSTPPELVDPSDTVPFKTTELKVELTDGIIESLLVIRDQASKAEKAPPGPPDEFETNDVDRNVAMCDGCPVLVKGKLIPTRTADGKLHLRPNTAAEKSLIKKRGTANDPSKSCSALGLDDRGKNKKCKRATQTWPAPSDGECFIVNSPPPPDIASACPDDTTRKPHSLNTCNPQVPLLDEFGGVHWEKYDAVGELWRDRSEGLDSVFEWKLDFLGWNLPLVTHHDYLLDWDWHDDVESMSLKWSHPWLLKNPVHKHVGYLPSDCTFEGAQDLKPLRDESVAVEFPYVDYGYRFAVKTKEHDDAPWFDYHSDSCRGSMCNRWTGDGARITYKNAGPPLDPTKRRVRGAITRHDEFGASEINRLDASLSTTHTRGSIKFSINPWYNIDMCRDWPQGPKPKVFEMIVKKRQCAPSVCIIPPPDDCPVRDKTTGDCVFVKRLWSDDLLWEEIAFADRLHDWASETAMIPAEGDYVEIPQAYHIVLDVNPPLLEKIMVAGVLELLDDTDRVIVTKVLNVYGDLLIGSEARPFRHKVDIRIHGNRTSQTNVLSSQHSLGNKNMIVFGRVRMQSMHWPLLGARVQRAVS